MARIDQLTQDELVKALVAGVSLTLPDGSSWTPLEEPIRRVLHTVWPGRIRSSDNRASAEEAEAILNAVKTEGSLPTWTPTPSSTAAPIWKLTRIVIRHFGGVNGATCKDAVEFDMPEKGLVIYGRNGSGKTSLSRALMWGLTGRVIDTEGTDKSANEITSSYKSDDGSCMVSLPTIVPFPTRAQLSNLATILLPTVTLTFRAPDGYVRLVERALIRSGRNFNQTCRWATASDDGQTPAWSTTEDVSTALGISRQSLENAALQIARLEKLNPSAERNPLAEGIERLSGLTRLGEVGDRLAGRLSQYVSGGYANGLQADADRERRKVLDAIGRINEGLVQGGLALPHGDTSTPEASKQYLDAIEASLAPKRAAAYRALSEVLGLAEGMSPPTDAQGGLIRARDATDNLIPDDRLETLLSICATPEKTAELREKVEEIEDRLERYEALQRDRVRKVRSALYARIEKWAEDEKQPAVDWSNCPVCETDLTDLDDPMLLEPIHQAAAQARRDAQLLRDDAVPQGRNAQCHRATDERLRETQNLRAMPRRPKTRRALRVFRIGQVPRIGAPRRLIHPHHARLLMWRQCPLGVRDGHVKSSRQSPSGSFAQSSRPCRMRMTSTPSPSTI